MRAQQLRGATHQGVGDVGGPAALPLGLELGLELGYPGPEEAAHLVLLRAGRRSGSAFFRGRGLLLFELPPVRQHLVRGAQLGGRG